MENDWHFFEILNVAIFQVETGGGGGRKEGGMVNSNVEKRQMDMKHHKEKGKRGQKMAESNADATKNQKSKIKNLDAYPLFFPCHFIDFFCAQIFRFLH